MSPYDNLPVTEHRRWSSLVPSFLYLFLSVISRLLSTTSKVSPCPTLSVVPPPIRAVLKLRSAFLICILNVINLTRLVLSCQKWTDLANAARGAGFGSIRIEGFDCNALTLASSAAASAGLQVMAGIYFDVGKLVFLVRTITERFRRGYVGNCCC